MKPRYIFHFITLAIIFMTGIISLQSCSDESSNGGQPVIKGVRVTDPEHADSLFTDGKLGQMIVVVGENLNDVRNVYINDQEISFNCNYNTSTHLILTIPSDLIVYGQDNSLPMEIRIVTSHGTATYGFHVIAGNPVIDFYSAELVEQPDQTLSMVPGMDVELHGSLFHEIEEIYIASTDTVRIATVNNWTLNDSCTVVNLKMPDNIPDYGIFVMKCYAGSAYCGFSKSPAEPEIYNVIPDMPVPGQQVYVFGKYLKDLTELSLCGEIDINIDDVTTFDSMDRLVFTMPDQLPSASSNGTLVVKTFGGRAEIPFYRYDWIYEDFDGHGPSTDWGWGTNFWLSNDYTDANPITQSSGVYALMVGTTCYWDHNYQWNSKGIVGDIPADTPADRIEIRYEAYIHEDIPAEHNVTGRLTIYHVEKGGIPFSDAVSGVFTPGKWMTISVPLTEWCPDAATYGDFCSHNQNGDYDFKMYIDYSEVGDFITLAYDNFRFYIKPTANE